MQVRQWIIAGVRTGVQRLVAIGLGALAAWAAARGWFFDIDVNSVTMLGLIDVVVTAAVTSALVRLEKAWPWLTPYLSLGMTSSPPQYEGPPPVLVGRSESGQAGLRTVVTVLVIVLLVVLILRIA